MWNKDILESARQAQDNDGSSVTLTNSNGDPVTVTFVTHNDEPNSAQGDKIYGYAQRDIRDNHVALVEDDDDDGDDIVKSGDLKEAYQGLNTAADDIKEAYQGLKTATDMLVEKTKVLEFTIAKLDCQPGDTVVFKVPGWAELSWEYRERAVAYVSKMVPDGVKVLFMDKDVELVVVRCDDPVQC